MWEVTEKRKKGLPDKQPDQEGFLKIDSVSLTHMEIKLI